jgi:uncharacterized protein (TIGR03435 family)
MLHENVQPCARFEIIPMRTICSVVLPPILCFASHVVGQTSPAFDVVSIRPSNAGDDQWSMQLRAGGDEFRAMGMPLGETILAAYFPFHLQSEARIVGAPSWVWNDKYDFVGKVGESDLQNWQKLSRRGFAVNNPLLQTMLQNALADRCKMTVHRVAMGRIGGI